MSAVEEPQRAAAFVELGRTPQRTKIVLDHVTKAFGSSNGPGEVMVLDRVSLDVFQGEFIAIVGPSGCGKTTLLNCMAGFESINSGVIEIDGDPVRRPSSRRVFVFQEPGIFPWLTVSQNIGFGLPGNLSHADRAARIGHHVKIVGLQGFERSYPGELSGGMKQRVEFARALAVDPDVLFLDEPFGSLDALTRLEMRREIMRIWKTTGMTCVLVTHDVEEACDLADRIAVMTRRPARIDEVVVNDLSRPRDPDTREFGELKRRIFKRLGVERRI
jgi:NitT/TauT family transport system ATP-binding protein